MADGVFNIAKGRWKELQKRVVDSDAVNAVLVVVLFQTSEADGVLEDYDTLAAIFVGANTEATFTSYVRKVLDQAVLTNSAPDDTNNWQQVDIPDQTWSPAGGATNNSLTKVIICYDDDSATGNDTNLIPLTHHDFTPTTNGNDLVLQIGVNGTARAV